MRNATFRAWDEVSLRTAKAKPVTWHQRGEKAVLREDFTEVHGQQRYSEAVAQTTSPLHRLLSVTPLYQMS